MTTDHRPVTGSLSGDNCDPLPDLEAERRGGFRHDVSNLDTSSPTGDFPQSQARRLRTYEVTGGATITSTREQILVRLPDWLTADQRTRIVRGLEDRLDGLVQRVTR